MSRKAMRVIALEEHYADPELLGATGFDVSRLPASRRAGLTDHRVRLADMDRAGIDLQVLSALPPGMQQIPGPRAAIEARAANRRLHEQALTSWPDRFAAFATLPLTDPDASAAELDYAVRELGFLGAMIHGMAGDRFLDHPDFAPILDAAAELGVPLYLHPGFPPPAVIEAYYSCLSPAIGHALASHAYGWHYETSLHALRLIAAGVFDRLPTLQIILGHLGEGLPFHLPRIERMLSGAAPHLAHLVSSYVRNNFWITTSGYFDDEPLRLARHVFGDARIMFSVDYPFSDNTTATDWLHGLGLEPDTWHAIAHRNAEHLLGLTSPVDAPGATP
ncbi:amidohydrolase family protein [Mycolicibacterium sp. YH-1]|uniref:amidohydrolase family protein n=1 Tax=Mycolicibacterium sp. YH-1 TaxID=2908837 RepID=UPI001F4BD2CE|nr:amidohydrolase family protein [Mycolicibacterium sp. YH-1]UNB55826.1 amidohydrolase family protein [Mycolicibacterium sp. YH-1]